jgi:hypothetical protein
MKKGSKWPALCTCVEENQYMDVIVKFRGALPRDRFAFVTEHVASLFAKDLGLESSDIVAVEVLDDLADVTNAAGYTDFARLIERSVGFNVGSIHLGPGFHTALPSEKEAANLRSTFTSIPAFDFLIQNLDRQPGNPNFLRKGKRLVLIDHEQAFGHLEEAKGKSFVLRELRLEPFFNHAFFPILDLASDFGPFFDRLANLPDTRINGYLEDLPSEWSDERVARLTDYLRWARGRAAEIHDHLRSHIVP